MLKGPNFCLMFNIWLYYPIIYWYLAIHIMCVCIYCTSFKNKDNLMFKRNTKKQVSLFDSYTLPNLLDITMIHYL